MQTTTEEYSKYYDVVQFQEGEDLDTFLERIKYRYEAGDTKVTKKRTRYYYKGMMIYQLSDEGKWELYSDNLSSWQYRDMDISLKIFVNDKYASDLFYTAADLGSDYIFPECRTAMLNRARTDKLRRKRAKPACMKEKEEEET